MTFMRFMSITLLSLIVAGCWQEVERAPDDADVTEALRSYYENTAPSSHGRQVERKVVRRLKVDEDEPDEAQTDEPNEEPSDPGEMQAEKVCPELSIIVKRANGVERQESLRVPCEALEQAQKGLNKGLETMETVLESLSMSIEGAFAQVTNLEKASRIACVPARERPGYVCDVHVVLAYGDGSVRERLITGRFVHGPEGWVVLDIVEGAV